MHIHLLADHRRLRHAIGASGLAIAVATAAPAIAACSPNPTQANITTTCTDVEPNGLTISTFAGSVQVSSGAQILSGTGDAGILSNAGFASLTVNGAVSGGTKPGVIVTNGAPYIITGYDPYAGSAPNYTWPVGNLAYPSGWLQVSIGAAGSIAGSNAIRLQQRPDNGSAAAYASIYNSGLLSGTDGPALLATAGTYFDYIGNDSTGTINGIAGAVDRITNSGRIDGGSGSAISAPLASGHLYYTSLTNEGGQILSNSNTATINFTHSNLYNSGTIANAGSGLAITTPGNLSIQNTSSGTIGSAGVIAIRTGGSLNLSNQGKIKGSVISLSTSGTGSSIDTLGGTIDGDLILGATDDRLSAAYDVTTGKIANITGIVDGGAGIDTIIFGVNADTTIDTIPLPTNFERFGLNLSEGAAVTLGQNLAIPFGVALSGSGTVTVAGTVNAIGSAFTTDFAYYSGLSFINQGAITATLATNESAAVNLGGYARFENSGSIVAIGGKGVILGYNTASNSGSIVADRAAVTASASFDNSGTIQSNQDYGITIFASSGIQITNSGAISGALGGVSIFGATLVNTGSISSPNLGIDLSPYGVIDNRAGATISGGVDGIGTTLYGYTFNTRVTNAGTINGNVDFGSSGFAIGSGNTFIALAGGVVNGNLRLGGYDLFVTSLVNTGPGQYAGVTGTVTGGTNNSLRYIVDSDATTAIATNGTFATTGYEVSNGALLTLNASDTQQRSIDVAGIGKVDLTADLSQTNGLSIVNLTAQSVLGSYGTSNALDVTSHGTLTATRDQSQYYVAPLVRLYTGSTFTNAGTIAIHDSAGNNYGLLTGVSGSGTFVNTGTIKLDGGVAVVGDIYSSALDVTNSGSIEQFAGGADGQGISGARSITNSGSIVTGGTAILLGSTSTVTNSGTIRSTGGPAIANSTYYGSGASILNQAGGVIAGKSGGAAMLLVPGASVDNAGTIDGTVLMNFSPSPYYTSYGNSSYISRGGTLNGDLSFGTGDDIFVSIGGSTGVSGTIDGGAGTDTYAIGYTSSQTVTANGTTALNFERQGIGAIGADTTITIDAASTIGAGLQLFGDGTIVNEADIGAAANNAPRNILLLGVPSGVAGLQSAFAFINKGVIADGIDGTTASLDNSGTIGSASLGGTLIYLTAANTEAFSFTNSGKIISRDSQSCSYYYCYIDNAVSLSAYATSAPLLKTVTIANGAGGEIQGQFYANLGLVDLAFTNDGLMSASLQGQPAVGFYQSPYGGEGAPGISPNTAVLTNTGTIKGGVSANIVAGSLTFTNSGSIDAANNSQAVSLTLSAAQAIDPVTHYYTSHDQDKLSFSNSGSIAGAVSVSASATSLDATNFGTIAVAADTDTQFSYTSTALNLGLTSNADQAVAVANGGSIVNHASAGSALVIGAASAQGSSTINVDNGGKIIADGGAIILPSIDYYYYHSLPTIVTTSAIAINASATEGASVNITNATGGTISASGDTGLLSNDVYTPVTGALAQTGATAILASADTITIRNDGTISGGAGKYAPDGLVIGRDLNTSSRYIAGAIQTANSVDTLINGATGVIIGSIDLGEHDDRLENYGSITGDIFLRDGDDSFVQAASATLVGTVDGGDGLDSLMIDANAGGGTINAAQFVNFERFGQTGAGKVSYIGAFASDTISLSGGTIAVDAGQMLSSGGAVTITGGSDADSVINAGTIAGAIDLGAGNDNVVNSGTILGAVALGDGDDNFSESPGSTVVGGVSGGAGTDIYHVLLNGDRTGIGARSGFEQLAVEGSGTLGLTLDQDFASVSLVGSGLDLRLAGFTPGRIDGSAADERLTIDGPVASIALGGGNDRLTTGGKTFAGSLDGGAGIDILSFTASDPVRIDGSITGFETIALAGGTLDIAGTVGTAGNSIAFGDGAQHLIVESGGTLAGSIDLGAGDDSLELMLGSVLAGTVSGGAGFDLATIHVDRAATLSGDVLSQFERVTLLGNIPLTIGSGTMAVDRLDTEGGLTIGAGAALNAGQVQFGAGDNQFVIAGGFSGSADGGAGTDALMLSGGSQAAPVALGNVAGFESLQESAGFASILGSAGFSSISLTGGRLVGLAGSSIVAPQINVGGGSTFGSAGSVTGNIAVSGTLSPGASPGTMTVVGNVALAAGSTSLFEITPTVTDKLLISGTLTIASGATLSLTGDRPLTPGSTLDLIVADNGITGSFTTIIKPASIFGFVAQRGNRIQLLGQFANDAAFPLSARRSIDYVNGVLTGGSASMSLLNALPSLLTSAGTSNAAAFTRLSPEAYASAQQIGVENGLVLIGAARDRALANGRGKPGAFGFAEGIGAWRNLKGSDSGAARADINGDGLLGGLGWDGGDWAIGGFTGYLDSHQKVKALDARTDANGIIAGVQARASVAGIDLGAMIAYDGGDARTRRALPGNGTANGRFSLHGWTADLSAAANLALSSNWSIRPQAGFSYVWTNRGAVNEGGGSPFALAVARSRDHAAFADAGLRIVGGGRDGDRLHPYAAIGGRYQLSGRTSTAIAALGGGGSGLIGEGVTRGRLLATADAGLSFDATANLSLFASYGGEWGKDDGRQSGRLGIRIGF